jgi:hypothetical protein
LVLYLYRQQRSYIYTLVSAMGPSRSSRLLLLIYVDVEPSNVRKPITGQLGDLKSNECHLGRGWWRRQPPGAPSRSSQHVVLTVFCLDAHRIDMCTRTQQCKWGPTGARKEGTSRYSTSFPLRLEGWQECAIGRLGWTRRPRKSQKVRLPGSSYHSPCSNAIILPPSSWVYRRKWAATLIVSSFTFISPVSSSMIAPASAQLASDFGITSSVLTAMTISVFILGYGKCGLE